MTLIQTPFGWHLTAAEVVKGIDLSDKRAIVTGAASGIGIETARALARTGAEVTLAVRDINSGVAPYALNSDNADRLWEESLRLLA